MLKSHKILDGLKPGHVLCSKFNTVSSKKKKQKKVNVPLKKVDNVDGKQSYEKVNNLCCLTHLTVFILKFLKTKKRNIDTDVFPYAV